MQYHLYVLEKIKRGLDDVEQGRTYSQEKVEAYFNRKWPEVIWTHEARGRVH